MAKLMDLFPPGDGDDVTDLMWEHGRIAGDR